MHVRKLHEWNLAPAEAIALQRELASQIVRTNQVGEVRRIAGVDVAAGRAGEKGRASVVILDYPTFDVIEVANAEAHLTFPYIPGLLSIRELPAVVSAFERVQNVPDLVIVDGQGVAHPRRFGIACHLGLWLDLPTFGCAKSILRGTHPPLGEEFGSTAPLVDRDEVVGMAVRTRTGVRPVYVSIGNKIDLETAVAWTLACSRGHRLPEPTRLAHLAAGQQLRA